MSGNQENTAFLGLPSHYADNTYKILVSNIGENVPAAGSLPVELSAERVSAFFNDYLSHYHNHSPSLLVSFPVAAVKYAFHRISLTNTIDMLSRKTVAEHLGALSVKLEFDKMGLELEAQFDTLDDHCNDVVVNAKMLMHCSARVFHDLKYVYSNINRPGLCHEHFVEYKTSLYLPNTSPCIGDVTTLRFAVVGLRNFGSDSVMRITGLGRKSSVAGHSANKTSNIHGQETWFEMGQIYEASYKDKYVNPSAPTDHALHGLDFCDGTGRASGWRGDALFVSQY